MSLFEFLDWITPVIAEELRCCGSHVEFSVREKDAGLALWLTGGSDSTFVDGLCCFQVKAGDAGYARWILSQKGIIYWG